MKRKKNITISIVIALAVIFILQLYSVAGTFRFYRLQFERSVNNITERATFTALEEKYGSAFAGGGLMQQQLFSSGIMQYGQLMETFITKGDSLSAQERDSLLKVMFRLPVVQTKLEELFSQLMSGSYKSDTSLVPVLLAMLRQQLQEEGIDTAFEYKVTSPFARRADLTTVLAGSDPEFDKLPFLSKEIILRQSGFVFQLGFHAPSVYRYILREMAIILISNLLLLLILAGTLLYLIRSFRNQQKLTLLKDDFVNNMSHELKTPVTTAKVALEALNRYDYSQDKPRADALIRTAGRELQRLALIVDKIMRTTSMQAGYLELYKEPVDLVHLVQETADSFRSVFEEQNITFQFSYPDEPLQVQADKGHLTNVIYNLIENAVKYKANRPQIWITLNGEEDRCILRITDNGIGIAPAFRDKIFDKFFRIPSGDVHAVKGQGIGLYYVKQIIQKHEGQISLAQGPEGFTTFIITLPR